MIFQQLMIILAIQNLQTAAHDWDLRLTDLEFAMRTSPHSDTGVSPMEMMTGFAPRLPTD
jgi:hypothetical protein